MPSISFTFDKSERLCSKKAIADLFENGRSFYLFPLQVIWTFSENEQAKPAQVAFSVSKRLFKKAVSRNLIRRRMREAYRLHKHTLYEALEHSGKKITFILIFKDKEALPFAAIEKSVVASLNRLISETGA